MKDFSYMDHKPGDPRNWPFNRKLWQDKHGPYSVSQYFKVEFDELADPSHDHNIGFRDLEIFAHLVRTAPEGTPGNWRTAVSGGRELLSANPSVINMSAVAGLGRKDWRNDLVKRFRYAMFYRHTSEVLKEWRREIGLVPGGTLTVPGPHVNPYSKAERNPSHAEMTDRVHDLFWEAEGLLAWSLNDCHPKAIGIQGVGLDFNDDGRLAVEVRYGYPPQDSSSWSHTLAAQSEKEPMLVTVDRANRELARLKDPTAEPPRTGYKRERIAAPAPNVSDLIMATEEIGS